MENTELPYSNHVRFLGVELDSKLSWKRHVLEKVRIAKFNLMHVRRVIGKLWGLSPKITRWAGLLLDHTACTHIWLSCVGKGNNR